MKWLHVIGICGKTTANVAKMFQDMGWFVTGSDAQFFQPAYQIILDNKLPHVEGYHFSHLTKEFWQKELNVHPPNFKVCEIPDLVMIVESVTSKNKEYLFAKNKKIPVKPYSQLLRDFLVKPESIVVVGTAGKTTTTSLITKLLKESNLNPSYMIGADVIDFKESIQNTDSQWSVIEGDEYYSIDLAKELQGGPKFLEYKPKYFVITNIGYEHQDVYPTQEAYIEAFKKGISLIPKDGMVIAKGGDKNIDKALEDARCKIIRFSYGEGTVSSDYVVRNIGHNADFLQSFEVTDHEGKSLFKGHTNLFGTYNLENLLITYIINSVVLNPSLSDRKLEELFENFKGPRKRLELLGHKENLYIFDDFGVAPNRAKNSIRTLYEHFSKHKDVNLIVVFEPNAGSRPNKEEEFKNLYKDAFAQVQLLILPEFSEYNENLVTSAQATTWLKDLGVNTFSITESSIIANINENLNISKLNIVVFMSAYRLTNLAHKYAQITG